MSEQTLAETRWSAWLSTARLVTCSAEERLAGISSGALGPALSFAIATEVLAVASLVPMALAAAWLLFPHWTQSELLSARGGTGVIASCLAFALLLVALHVAFGGAVEFAIRRTQRYPEPAQWRRSMRFALYACGWDLWSSPLGVLLAMAVHGRSEVVALFAGAQLAPRRSLEHYMLQVRGLEQADKRRVTIWLVALLLPPVAVGAVAWMVGTWWLLLR